MDKLIGTEISAPIGRKIRENLFEVESSLIPDGWQGVLHRRDSQQPPARHERQKMWIHYVDLARRVLRFTDSDFGKVAPSERTITRYREALSTTLAAIETRSLNGLSPEVLSELKGMLNRTVRRDQPDWYVVWDALDRPGSGFAAEIAEALGDLARAMRREEGRSVVDGFNRLLQRDLKPRLQTALERLPVVESRGDTLVESTPPCDAMEASISAAIRSGDLMGGLRLWSKSEVSIAGLRSEIDELTRTWIQERRVGELLSAAYTYSLPLSIPVVELIRLLGVHGDYAGLLKHASRFEIHQGLESEIANSIRRLREEGNHSQADAYESKFRLPSSSISVSAKQDHDSPSKVPHGSTEDVHASTPRSSSKFAAALRELRARLNIDSLPDELLVNALTHVSYARDFSVRDNRSLALLGDLTMRTAVVVAVTNMNPTIDPGDLANQVSLFLGSTNLAKVANALSVPDCLRMRLSRALWKLTARRPVDPCFREHGLIPSHELRSASASAADPASRTDRSRPCTIVQLRSRHHRFTGGFSRRKIGSLLPQAH